MNDPIARRVFLARLSAAVASTAAGTAYVASSADAAPSTPRAVPESLHDPNAYAPPRPEALADITELTIAEAATLIRDGRLDPRLLVEAYLDRIVAFDDTYQAWNVVLADGALAAAEPPEPRPYEGALHGVPLAIKDNYFTAGVPTTANSFIFQDFVPPFDATAVANLTSAGAIVLGKTQMGPLATTRATAPNGTITTVNAWAPTDPATDPGGSSTGTATAVAGRMVTSGIGTQTGGSITSPSNAQNLTGLKPTMGRASLHGIIPLTYTRDHPGPLARDAKDAAIMLTAMAGPDDNDLRTLGLPALPDLITAATPLGAPRQVRLRWPTRIGVIPGYVGGSGPTAQARQAFLDTLAGVPGATVVDVSLPEDWALLTGGTFNNVRLPERSEPFMPFLRTDLHQFGVSLTSWLQGALLGGNEFIIGQRAKLLLIRRVLDDLFAQCDVVVQTSPVPFDIIGLPELALPIGFTAEGLPIGTIIGGGPYAEHRLLAVAAAYQALTDWHFRRPADPPGEAPQPTPVDGEPMPRRSAARFDGRITAPRADPARGVLTAEQVAELSE
jgi:Asp-tRNA(Asn)/Glu-tRNA(Gln) amidotransferase A subunit family amidase